MTLPLHETTMEFVQKVIKYAKNVNKLSLTRMYKMNHTLMTEI